MDFLNKHKKAVIAAVIVLIVLFIVAVTQFVYLPHSGKSTVQAEWYEMQAPIEVRIAHIEQGEVIEDAPLEISQEQLQEILDFMTKYEYRARNQHRELKWKDREGETSVRFCPKGDPEGGFCYYAEADGTCYLEDFSCMMPVQLYEQVLMMIEIWS